MPIALIVLAALVAGSADDLPVTISAPVTVVEIDRGDLDGDLVRLAWSPDGGQLYLRAVQRDRFGNERVKHFVLPARGGRPARVAENPAWAELYWRWKSHPKHPGDATFAIALESRRETIRATGAPSALGQSQSDPSLSGGGLGGTTVSASQAAEAAAGMQATDVHTMRLKGEVVGKFVNVPIAPGATFGWAPKPLALIAFAGGNGKLVVMDPQGRKREIAHSRDVMLPAWSDDGRRLVYVERVGRKKIAIKVLDVQIGA